MCYFILRTRSCVNIVHHEGQELILCDWRGKGFFNYLCKNLFIFILLVSIPCNKISQFLFFLLERWRRDNFETFSTDHGSEMFKPFTSFVLKIIILDYGHFLVTIKNIFQQVKSECVSNLSIFV